MPFSKAIGVPLAKPADYGGENLKTSLYQGNHSALLGSQRIGFPSTATALPSCSVRKCGTGEVMGVDKDLGLPLNRRPPSKFAGFGDAFISVKIRTNHGLLIAGAQLLLGDYRYAGTETL